MTSKPGIENPVSTETRKGQSVTSMEELISTLPTWAKGSENLPVWKAQSRSLYGSLRIAAELKKQGFGCGKNRVARIMKEHSIRAAVKKRRFRRTTDSRYDYALASNLLVERSQTEGVWASI